VMSLDHTSLAVLCASTIRNRTKASLGNLHSSTRTSSGNTSDINVSIYSSIRFLLKVTAVSGTNPTLDVYIEGRYDQTGDYEVLLQRTGVNANGTYFMGQVDNLVFRNIRIRWVIGGTSPSFNFTVTAMALV
jgi:hypothetical protein